MKLCERFQKTLNTKGRDGVMASEELTDHIDECADCANLLAGETLDSLLGELPTYQPSAELIDKVIGQARRPLKRLRQPPRTLRLAVAASFALVMVAAIGVSMNVWIAVDRNAGRSSTDEPFTFRYDQVKEEEKSDSTVAQDMTPATAKPAPPASLEVLDSTPNIDMNTRELAKELARQGARDGSGPPLTIPDPAAPKRSSRIPGSLPFSGQSDRLAGRNQAADEEVRALAPYTVIKQQENNETSAQSSDDTTLSLSAEEPQRPAKTEPGEKDSGAPAPRVLEEEHVSGWLAAKAPEFSSRSSEQIESGEGQPDALDQSLDMLDLDAGSTVGYGSLSETEVEESNSRSNAERQMAAKRQRVEARRYNEVERSLGERIATTDRFDLLGGAKLTHGLSFLDATGYWSSPYIPGDPEIRALAARLDRAQDARPDDQIIPYAKGFDAPKDAALNLHLRSDVRAIEGPTRARIQVGLQAIEHRIGRRPAMNLVALLDIPDDADDSLRIQARALLDGLLESQQAGDQFTLVSSRGGTLVSADSFAHGTVQLALREQFESVSSDAAMPLSDAMKQAYATLAEQREPSQGLGSSTVLLITADELSTGSDLLSLVHRNAVDGSTLSVFPLGNQPDLNVVDSLVSTGLGNRRLMVRAAQARDLIEEELASANRAVARSARLSIRLAPGTHLVGIFNSQRLAEPEAERVREIEQSMDQRLQRNRGIVADRGDDEQGIQIVIPNIYTADSLSILLDVVVDKPGPVAEVTLRYKDLVFLTNNSQRAQLSFERGANQPGPMQRLVQKDLLAWRFASAVRTSATLLAAGDIKLAQAELEALRDVLEQARDQVPGWRQDREIKRDIDALNHYLELIEQPLSGNLSDSLKYAAWRKTHQARTEQ